MYPCITINTQTVVYNKYRNTFNFITTGTELKTFQGQTLLLLSQIFDLIYSVTCTCIMYM